MAVEPTRYSIRDIGVRMARAGVGAPALFLHGAGGFPGWTPFHEKLAAGCDLRAPEHPGFGLSDHPPWIRSTADMAMYYLDFVEALGAGRMHVIGHSLGGWIAAEMAVRNCALLASLTLIAPAGVRVKGIISGDNFIWAPDEAVRNLHYDQALAEKILAQPMSDEDADLALTNRYMAAKLGWEPRWYSPSLERWLHRIKVPVLVVWGREDKLLPAAYAEAWRAGVPDIRVEIVPEAGHLPHIEKPDLVAQHVLGFIGAVAGRPA